MADQSDVEQALTALISSVVYPNGTGQPNATGRDVSIYRGWPNSAALDTDLAAGRINVTVFPEALRQVNTTRWPDDFTFAAPVAPTVTIATTRTTATLGGTAASGQVVGLLVDALAVVYRVVGGDTLASIAGALGSEIAQVRPVQVAGPTVTVPGAGAIVGRVVADQPGISEARRQRQRFRVTAWCPTPATRDQIAALIDVGLATQRFLALADGTSGRLRFLSSATFDQSQDAALYRRDLIYSVDYATTVNATMPSMIFGNATLTATNAGQTSDRIQ